MSLRLGLIIAGLLLGASCAAPPSAQSVRQAAADPGASTADRLRALHQLQASGRDQDALPTLLELLDHEDGAVRDYAVRRIERIAGRTFSLRPYAPIGERSHAVAEIRRWARERPAPSPERTP